MLQRFEKLKNKYSRVDECIHPKIAQVTIWRIRVKDKWIPYKKNLHRQIFMSQQIRVENDAFNRYIKSTERKSHNQNMVKIMLENRKTLLMLLIVVNEAI